MWPPKLPYGDDEKHYSQYADAYRKLYMGEEKIRDAEGFDIKFVKPRVKHICFKEDRDSWNGGHRPIWMPERAKRISWIGLTLSDPEEIRKGDASDTRVYYLKMEEAVEDGSGYGMYCVVAEPTTKDNELFFVTAYPFDTSADWHKSRRKNKGSIYTRPAIKLASDSDREKYANE